MKAGESEIPPPVKSPSRPLLRLESSPLLFFSHRTYFFLILNLPPPPPPLGNERLPSASCRRPQKKKRMRPFLSSFRRQGTAELTDSPVVPDSLSDSREKLEIQLQNRKVNVQVLDVQVVFPPASASFGEMERRRAVTVAVMVVVVAAAMARRSSFTPCVNYLTGSKQRAAGADGAECCGAFGGLLSSSTSCACQILTGSIPSLPFNRTLALKLPSYCNSTSIDLFKCPGTLPTTTTTLPPIPAAAPPRKGFSEISVWFHGGRIPVTWVLLTSSNSPPRSRLAAAACEVQEAPPQAPPFVIPSSASKPVAYLAGLLAGAAAGALC
ncbi:unnamed protein product [Spirodela intermedia]|uniref:Bifunctional inhibitor/plant lipid transfer protein/seed storage helical domain-containing protein n=1 Tax=Spirodela intermedia TaxID=51605 RepID=A0ABN7EBJ2_SPIIN|nr:unnamed protein product [Spirodela intermedia]